jgi:hypothetical protein
MKRSVWARGQGCIWCTKKKAEAREQIALKFLLAQQDALSLSLSCLPCEFTTVVLLLCEPVFICPSAILVLVQHSPRRVPACTVPQTVNSLRNMAVTICPHLRTRLQAMVISAHPFGIIGPLRVCL